MMKLLFSLILLLLLCSACDRPNRKQAPLTAAQQIMPTEVALLPDTLVDASYSFEEAIAGSSAPREVLDLLELREVHYHSVDGQIHRGQILCNREISDDISELFAFMLEEGFVIEKVVPVVRYGWSDSLSMADNNSYSFCYRNTGYSKHARGMAIDINPRFNPLRWKRGERPNKPEGAIIDTTRNGTLYPGHPVVKAFTDKGFRWGHTFSKYYDDHHFEKQ
ncbi:MAG: M15 family peptidase [Bacteroidia bacterium]|jgi:hypothetical protein|nr:M15 family peptidase [Bacteroidia bacterium]HHT34557.1 M15 family metallopeptidase [Bacteroidales bacterium]